MYSRFVREVRESRRLSQREVSEVSGITQSNISAFENNRRVPSADSLNRILVACGYEMAAVAGEQNIFCDLPRIGWFPDEDLPPRLPDDPPDEEPSVDVDTPIETRVQVITAVLEAATGGAPRPQ